MNTKCAIPLLTIALISDLKKLPCLRTLSLVQNVCSNWFKRRSRICESFTVVWMTNKVPSKLLTRFFDIGKYTVLALFSKPAAHWKYIIVYVISTIFLTKIAYTLHSYAHEKNNPKIVCKNIKETCMGFSRYAIHVLNVIKLK